MLFKIENGHILINDNGNHPFPQPLMVHGPNLLSFIQVVYNNIQNINSRPMNTSKITSPYPLAITLSTISIITSLTFFLKFLKHFSMQTLLQNMGVVLLIPIH